LIFFVVVMTADPNSEFHAPPPPKIWKTTLFLIGSAAFGGLAVALWNRRELAQMRNQKSKSAVDVSPSPAQPDEETF
jgi:hypothetical protein